MAKACAIKANKEDFICYHTRAHEAREERCHRSHSSNNGARGRGRIDKGHRPTDRHLPFTSFLSFLHPFLPPFITI